MLFAECVRQFDVLDVSPQRRFFCPREKYERQHEPNHSQTLQHNAPIAIPTY
jgi:hypothetical protein